MNVEDEFYLLTRKSSGETFVCNMTVEERDNSIIEEQCQRDKIMGHTQVFLQGRSLSIRIRYIMMF